MCGIVAAIASRNVVPILLEGLKRLEYRGYDSAGVAVINGSMQRLRSCGRVATLAKLASEQNLHGNIGIGHTRWATHGVPSERNAHPHVSGGVSVVHNGIIENHDAMRARLQGLGYEFSSDTDTEVIAHLVHSFLACGANLFQAVRAATKELVGAYAIAVIAMDDPSRMVVARMGAPLLLGLGDGENFAASDTAALLQVTRRMIYLEEGDCAEVTLKRVNIVDARGHGVERPPGLPCNVEIASESRSRESVPNQGSLVVVISQSGETADSIAALHHARALGQPNALAICNVPESALIRACKLRFLTRAGPEIGVASTKAFTAQLASLFVLALVLAKQRNRLTKEKEVEMLEALRRLPAWIANALRAEPEMAAWAAKFARCEHALFLGRGVHYPIAMEGALKLKEISYIHAEAYAAGELKHGPLALVDRNMPVVAIAPRDLLLDKLKSNLQEVRARGGELYVLANGDTALSNGEGVHIVQLHDDPGLLSPIVSTVPLQLLAYHAALIRGNDVDKPRNLAKSVTVE